MGGGRVGQCGSGKLRGDGCEGTESCDGGGDGWWGQEDRWTSGSLPGFCSGQRRSLSRYFGSRLLPPRSCAAHGPISAGVLAHSRLHTAFLG